MAFSLLPYSLLSLLKEAEHYKKELVSNQARMEEMLSAEKDTFDIKLFQQVVDESRMMVPDSAKRFAAAVEDLQDFVDANNALEGEWMVVALSVLAEQGKKETFEGAVPETNIDDLAEGEAF